MRKEELIALGLDEATAVKVEKASTEELKTFIPKTRFDEVNTEKKKLEDDVKDRDKQLETLKTSTGDVEALKIQITTLQAENKTKDETHAAELKQLKAENAINAALATSKAKNPKAARALLDIDIKKVEFNDDGTIKGLDDQIKKLTEAEDSKFLFDTESKPGIPKFKGVNPGEGKGGAGAGSEGAPSSLAEAIKLKLSSNNE
jgi:hypothetical protein